MSPVGEVLTPDEVLAPGEALDQGHPKQGSDPDRTTRPPRSMPARDAMGWWPLATATVCVALSGVCAVVLGGWWAWLGAGLAMAALRLVVLDLESSM